jgi:hypothetical protein
MKHYKHNNGHDYLKIVDLENFQGHFSRNLKGFEGRYCYQLCDASLIMLDEEVLKLHWVEISETEYMAEMHKISSIFLAMQKRIEAQVAITGSTKIS